MQNQISTFTHEAFGSVRTEIINGSPYFCAKDVATALGYSDPRRAVSYHCTRGVESGRLNYRGNHFTMIPVEDVVVLSYKSRLATDSNVVLWLLSLVKQVTGKEYLLYVRREEFVALSTIEQLLGVKLERQYKVGPYRIDGYDKQNNVAYEIDEGPHRRQLEDDKNRELFLKKELNCSFVRIQV